MSYLLEATLTKVTRDFVRGSERVAEGGDPTLLGRCTAHRLFYGRGRFAFGGAGSSAASYSRRPRRSAATAARARASESRFSLRAEPAELKREVDLLVVVAASGFGVRVDGRLLGVLEVEPRQHASAEAEAEDDGRDAHACRVQPELASVRWQEQERRTRDLSRVAASI